jgi:type II secretory pathway component PulF
MQDTLMQSLPSGPLHTLTTLVVLFLFYVVVGVLPSLAGAYLLYFLLTLPMRRNERARIFLDCLELGLSQGKTAEESIIAVSSSRDRVFGARFYVLGESLRSGARLSDALKLVPRLLPPQVNAMLRAGEKVGDIRRVLSACRQVLKDGVSQVRGALNYVILVVFVATPALVFVPIFLGVFVLPKYREVFAGMSEGPLPALSAFVFSEPRGFAIAQIATLLFIWFAVLAYLGGPRLGSWFNRIVPGLPDRIGLMLPWRRKRMQRDFSSMLALLLDAGVPEPEAVLLSGEVTCQHTVGKKRAVAVSDALRQGIQLPEALQMFDDSGELRWRMSNAVHSRTGFTQALAGWHESLDARAFQLEQSAAQIATTVFVLINGAIVACFVIAVFLVLIRIIESALW